MGKHGGAAIISGVIVKILAAFTIIIAVVIGIGLGLSLAETANIKNQEDFVEFVPALPSKIVDIHGTLITEFSGDEKRELISLSEIPLNLIHAVLAREDPDFYNHKGFSVRGIARAAAGQLIGKRWGGGSTITQQIAGLLYTNRTERTYRRKIKELWWAFQMERRYTKNEILEIYLNYINMGPGTYGVEAASQYFFGHSARDITLAEAALLAILPSSPSRYNPLDNPNGAMDRQRFVLDRMIEFGYTTREEAEDSFAVYWTNYDYTRASTAAYYHRADKAPWFSEYVRRELDTMIYGSMDYYRDGYTVHTTLNLRHQEAAEKFMAEGLLRANKGFAASKKNSNVQAEKTFIPIVELLTLHFNLSDIHATASSQNETRAVSRYTKTINPVVDMASLLFGIQDLKVMTSKGFGDLRVNTEQNVVEGALISIENETGYITAIVGGSKYDESNQLIRATQGRIQPGSTFKPLYYSAAIDSKKMTPSTLIYDLPIVFYNEDGTPYLPQNFKGEWKGSVLLYEALAQSMNVASLKVLDTIGFDAAIDRAAALLDIKGPDQIRRTFPRVYPLGLGIIEASPLRMARAFAVFGNQGREVTPIAIRSVEDRNGRVVLDTEREVRLNQRRAGNAAQVISPQNAYIMTKILEKTVEQGTLANGIGYGTKNVFKDENGKSFKMPMAGKTGTPQNWSDAWAIGYSPYYTSAVWFGFDKPGNSLGVNLTGSTLAGPVWGDYMREIHHGLPYRDFVRPATGIIDVTVCAKSGLLKNPSCNEGDVTLPFLPGTQPGQYCNIHGNNSWAGGTAAGTMRGGPLDMDDEALLSGLPMPTLPPDLFPELQNDSGRQNQTGQNNQNGRNNTRRNTGRGQNTNSRNNRRQAPLSWEFNNSNPLLDDDESLYLPALNSEPSAGEPPQRSPAATDADTRNEIPPETAGNQAETPNSRPEAGNQAADNPAAPPPDSAVHGLDMPGYNVLME
ncbi:MAG: PBP1A family penicillin-binding protein [Treponema sp.]|jgi:penicillin-binding protein 1A|nr:PBP1A family penicillin-binding protein [Treponema sp.]